MSTMIKQKDPRDFDEDGIVSTLQFVNPEWIFIGGLALLFIVAPALGARESYRGWVAESESDPLAHRTSKQDLQNERSDLKFIGGSDQNRK